VGRGAYAWCYWEWDSFRSTGGTPVPSGQDARAPTAILALTLHGRDAGAGFRRRHYRGSRYTVPLLNQEGSGGGLHEKALWDPRGSISKN
jgi:hypothetical protein